MNNHQDQQTLHAIYPNAIYLSETYLQLEGFTDMRSTPQAAAITMADAIDEAALPPSEVWKDIFVTFGVMLTLLVTGSVALGFSAHKITESLQHVSHEIDRQALGDRGTPTSWQF